MKELGEIELKSPYSLLWKKGFLKEAVDGRKYIYLVSGDRPASLTSYARYLMAVKLGAFISPELTVDHKDDDKTNDDINNLQLLTGPENTKKYGKHYREHIQKVHEIDCHECSSRIRISDRIFKSRRRTAQKRGTEGRNFCSRRCNAIYNRKIGAINVVGISTSSEMISKIRDLRSQGLSCYKISDHLGISRNTVMKYW